MCRELETETETPFEGRDACLPGRTSDLSIIETFGSLSEVSVSFRFSPWQKGPVTLH